LLWAVERVPRLSTRAGRRWRLLVQRPSPEMPPAGSPWRSLLAHYLHPGPRRTELEAGLEELAGELVFLLRAGLALLPALRAAARAGADPVRLVLQQALGRYDSGVSLEQTLLQWAAELKSEEANFLATVLLIGLRNGGDLPRMLNSCARILRDRRALQGEIAAHTVEARWSAVLVAATPVTLLAFFAVFQPDFLRPLARVEWGPWAVGYALVSWSSGVYLVWRLTRSGERLSVPVSPGGGSRR